MSLKQKTISGLFWTFSQQFSLKFISFFISIVLARLLTPEDFGLVGMLTIFIAVGSALMDSGLTTSLVRTNEADQEDYSTVFFINLVGSIGVYLIVFFAAPSIASFYNKPILTDLARLFCFTFIINAFTGVQNAKLTKEMKFKTQLTIQIPSLVGSGVLGVILAYLGFGVWSLVWMYISQSLMTSVQLWIRTGWHPNFKLNKRKLKYHFNFGYKLSISSILNSIFDNLYYVVIGKYFSAAQLGYYSRALSLQQLPVQNIAIALNRVTLPVFASIQHDDIKLKGAYRRMMQQVVFWLAPTLVFLAIVAEPLFVLVFTEKWLPAVPYFQLLCFAGILHPLHAYNLNILNVKGRSDLFLKLEVVKKIIIVIGVAFAIPYGIYGLLYFKIISSVIAVLINTRYSGRLINYPLSEQIKDLIPLVMLTSAVGSILYIFNIQFLSSLYLNDLARIVIIGIAYSIIYLGISYISKVPAIIDFKQLVLKK